MDTKPTAVHWLHIRKRAPAAGHNLVSIYRIIFATLRFGRHADEHNLRFKRESTLNSDLDLIYCWTLKSIFTQLATNVNWYVNGNFCIKNKYRIYHIQQFRFTNCNPYNEFHDGCKATAVQGLHTHRHTTREIEMDGWSREAFAYADKNINLTLRQANVRQAKPRTALARSN